MNEFKQKLDKMMGDTTSQENQIKHRVRQQLMNDQFKPKRSWRMPAIVTAFAVLVLCLISTLYINNELTANEGRGAVYDPLDDMLAIYDLRAENNFSTIDYGQFMDLPIVKELQPLQYIDSQPFLKDGQVYYPVIERQQAIFEETVYEQGDIVRALKNATSDLPTYQDVYYEVVALPGDRVVLHDGEFTVNGKKVKTDLMKTYEKNGNDIVGGYDRLLNAREYVLLNHFPAENTIQPVTINAVHKILGEVVALATKEQTKAIYFEDNLNEAEGYAPEDYFDLFLYDRTFGDGTIAKQLQKQTQTFPVPTRVQQYFLVAGYREITYISDTKVQIVYTYRGDETTQRTFNMYKDPHSNKWIWGI